MRLCNFFLGMNIFCFKKKKKIARHFTELLNCSHRSSPSSLPGWGLAATGCALKGWLTLNAPMEDRENVWEGKKVLILGCKAKVWSEACLVLKKRRHTSPCLGGGPSCEEEQSGVLVFWGSLRVRLPAL